MIHHSNHHYALIVLRVRFDNREIRQDQSPYIDSLVKILQYIKTRLLTFTEYASC